MVLIQFTGSVCLSRAIRQLQRRTSSARSRAAIVSANPRSGLRVFLLTGVRMLSALVLGEGPAAAVCGSSDPCLGFKDSSLYMRRTSSLLLQSLLLGIFGFPHSIFIGHSRRMLRVSPEHTNPTTVRNVVIRDKYP